MPLLIFIILVVLIAQVGFWNTLAAVVGGVVMIILLVILAGVALALIARAMLRRRAPW